MIKFKDAEFAIQRANVAHLSPEEERQAIRFLNDCIAANPAQHAGEQDLVQRLVWDYENMCHARTIFSFEFMAEPAIIDPFNGAVLTYEPLQADVTGMVPPIDGPIFDMDSPATEITPE